MNRIIVSKDVWDKMKNHLLKDHNEHLAFFFGNTVSDGRNVTFLVRNVKLISDKDFEPEGFSMKLNLDSLLEVTNEARRRKSALIEAHSHPFSTIKVGFSKTDINGFKEFVPYILDDIPGRPYAALVLGQDSVDGICWQGKVGEPIDKVLVHGDNLNILTPTSAPRQPIAYMEKRYDRQVLAFEKEGQHKIKECRVVVVGLGGIGSHVVQQLAYLGVRRFTIIDFDKVTDDSLNRLVGANIDSISKSKTEVASDMIKTICKGEEVEIKVIRAETREKEVLDSIKKVDFIFGCVDNDGARAVLNEFSKAYLIPYLDCATGINTEEGKISEIGGRVVLVKLGGLCLKCVNEIDVNEATHFLQTQKEQRNNRQAGYVRDYDMPSPSVVSLNGLIASAAVTEFIAYVTGFKDSKTYLAYDAMEQKLREIVVEKDPKCYICNSIEGSGDGAEIVKRYSRREAP